MRKTITTIPYNDSFPLYKYIFILLKERKTTCKKSLWISLQRNSNPNLNPFIPSTRIAKRNFHSKFQISQVHANERKGGEERENGGKAK